MKIDERLERLTGVVETLAASVAAGDYQIAAHKREMDTLIDLASKHGSGVEN